jgi:glycosyltransferase involved in cell wall biosynthesis
VRSPPTRTCASSAGRCHLAAELRSASLVLMPSRTEGFGLAGLEAINAGVPTLVSSTSGLGELIREACSRDQSAQVVVPVLDDSQADAQTWGREITTTLRDRHAAFNRAAALRDHLVTEHTWARSISAVLDELATTR